MILWVECGRGHAQALRFGAVELLFRRMLRRHQIAHAHAAGLFYRLQQRRHRLLLRQHVHRLRAAAIEWLFLQAEQRMAAIGIKAAQAQHVHIGHTAVEKRRLRRHHFARAVGLRCQRRVFITMPLHGAVYRNAAAVHHLAHTQRPRLPQPMAKRGHIIGAA